MKGRERTPFPPLSRYSCGICTEPRRARRPRPSRPARPLSSRGPRAGLRVAPSRRWWGAWFCALGSPRRREGPRQADVGSCVSVLSSRGRPKREGQKHLRPSSVLSVPLSSPRSPPSLCLPGPRAPPHQPPAGWGTSRRPSPRLLDVWCVFMLCFFKLSLNQSQFLASCCTDGLVCVVRFRPIEELDATDNFFFIVFINFM